MDFLSLADKVINGYQISLEEAELLINCSDAEVFLLTSAANKIKSHFFGNKVKLCSLVNAKSGSCSENCSFCAQSAHFNTDVAEFPLVSQSEIISEAERAAKHGATCFSVVTSGRGAADKNDFDAITNGIKGVTENVSLKSCASLGILTKAQLLALKAAGLKRFHHNLETARSFFPAICTTHEYEDRVQTVKDAKEIGLEVCSGGIFGLGETSFQRIELAFTLRELNVDSVPINILHPIPGTKAADAPSLKPLEALKLIAAYRFVFPRIDVGVLGGRESRMGDLQSFVLVSGANVILLGNYLTTQGRPAQKDLEMICNLGLEVS
ncbi:MAG: biotin synthase BioB [Candidatus Margulisiibacteriota bacterium]|nr:MAG: biotin synthase BioB [Candidatus Margulisbacteria bacterium GWD2_39_127]OGI04365.1 MAG: biotin synthase BioB [Candidatus Margulisbacteria bacterium GWF2_38_17]OGI07779.1 MAG: biotin synthase BioB [Candidatus Margulisbacteria bacterium GWE2_39_32]PZM84828.1 MAG: biotin synthase BioB [Candidatus Margulisiibacteriota bacterium]HAR63299.1 biotin synthase BioB [Candidatus Margulisiibacteriota bacterium]